LLLEIHLEKAKRLENGAKKLDINDDSELIIESVYCAAHDYIAYGLESKYKEHSDKHNDDFKFLRKHNDFEIFAFFQTLEGLRVGDFYGTKKNGERVKEALLLLEKIKRWAFKKNF